MKGKKIKIGRFWAIVWAFITLGLLIAGIVVATIPLISSDQITCLENIGKQKCSDFVKIWIVPDKISDSGYVCASFPDPNNNYPKFTTEELKSCGLTK